LDAAAVCAFDAAPWPAKYSVQRKRLAIGDPGLRSCPDPLGATQALRSLRKRAICSDPGQQGVVGVGVGRQLIARLIFDIPAPYCGGL
jgi:hypothetical protein